MAYKKKADREKEFVDYVKSIGIDWSSITHDHSNCYYCLMLKNEEQRYWTNFSEENLKELGIE